MISVPNQIWWAIGWCMVICCVGWWIKHLISYLIDDEKGGLFGRIIEKFSKER